MKATVTETVNGLTTTTTVEADSISAIRALAAVFDILPCADAGLAGVKSPMIDAESPAIVFGTAAGYL